MADAPATGVAYRDRRFAGVDKGGAEPKVARPARAEKIACAHDQRGHAFGRGSLQAALHFHTDRAFACFWMLRRILAQEWPGVGPEIVAVPGKRMRAPLALAAAMLESSIGRTSFAQFR